MSFDARCFPCVNFILFCQKNIRVTKCFDYTLPSSPWRDFDSCMMSFSDGLVEGCNYENYGSLNCSAEDIREMTKQISKVKSDGYDEFAR